MSEDYEKVMLVECVTKISRMICGRVAFREFGEPPAECECFSCSARGCLQAIATHREMGSIP